MSRTVAFDLMNGVSTYVTKAEGGLFGEGAYRFDEIDTAVATISKPPPSTIRQNRIDRFPRRHSHQSAPDKTTAPNVITVSGPGFTIPPPARPRTPPASVKQNNTFQNNANRACRKARASSLSSVAGDGF